MTGCAKARAETVPDGPPLATPAPPPRDVAPVEELAAAPAEAPTPDTPAARPASPAARPPATTAKPEPVVTPPPQPAVVEPPRELRPAPSAADERKVNDLLARTAARLKGVDYRRLSSDRRSLYDQARRFSEQADQALKDRNVPYAMTLADKAWQLADALAPLR
jgi:hypothetical protein